MIYTINNNQFSLFYTRLEIKKNENRTISNT
jgi:hypothetical protein